MYSRFQERPQDSGDSYRSMSATAHSGRTNDDRYASRDSNYRGSPPPPRYSPPHDSRTPPRRSLGSKHTASTRERDARRDQDNSNNYDRDRRERSPLPRSGPSSGYRDRDREGYKSPGYDQRSRSNSPPPRRDRSPYFGGPPSREVMMDGLPVDLTEEDVGHHLSPTYHNPKNLRRNSCSPKCSISKELKQFHNVDELDDIRVIRDRQTKVSRGFGFLRFPTIEKSRAFLERNYPQIHLYGNDSADGDDQVAKVRVAFSRERDDRSRAEKAEGEWACKICTFVNFPGRKVCFKCQAPQIDMAMYASVPAKPSEFLNSGDSDASPDGAPSQFLLLRGLEPTVTEDLLAKGVAKLYKPTGGVAPSTAASKKGYAKVASTTGDANLGAKDGSLRRVLLVRDRRSNESWRYGFAEFASVDDAQAALTRFNSFEKFTISSKPVTACYIHAGVFVPVFDVAPGKERYLFSPLANAATKLAYWDEDAYVNELVVNEAPEEISAAVTEARAKTATDKAAAAAEKEGLVAPGNESEMKAKKRKAEAKENSKPKKTAPAHLQFWSNRHAELHGVKRVDPTAAANEQAERTENPRTNQQTSTDSASTPSRSFADLTKKCCYLCSRQFKTDAEVNKHERLSQLHRDNLENEDLRTKALAKMAKAGTTLSTADEDTPEYRDRAKERRAAFGAGKKVSLPMKKSAAASLSTVDAKDLDSDDQPVAPSKGASLLGKMGWAAGEGLGAQGKGMTSAISTEMYVQGVGLGAEGGKIGDAVVEAEKNTKGDYGDFLRQTRDKAKERFEKMG